MTWRYNVHELDEWQGQTLSFRWESDGSTSDDLYIDDIKVEVWDANEFVSTSIPTSSYTFSSHPTGEYWFRAFAIEEPDFGPGWPSDPEYALVQGTGIGDEYGTDPVATSLGNVSPNPVTISAAIRVDLAMSDAGSAGLMIYDLSGRVVRDLSGTLTEPGSRTVHWNCTGDDGTPVPDGIYFCRLTTGSLQETRRLVVAR